MSRVVKKWFSDESGQAMAEYGLLIALVIAGLVILVVAFRDKLGDAFKAATAALGTKPL
ncbi:MAG: Flp family type IVb pilin [Candidatus Magasanikbacteria bacterium]|nr:Flp family type IVb pilin [Candidatus Magasanikbacteria bacterium]